MSAAALLPIVKSTPPQFGPEFLTVAEAARRCKLHEDTLRRWIARGVIPGYAPPGTRAARRVRLDEIMQPVAAKRAGRPVRLEREYRFLPLIAVLPRKGWYVGDTPPKPAEGAD